jgi:hypothetical protein
MLVIDGLCLPGPPLKKFINPGSRSWTRGILEEIYDIVPEYLVIEISIYVAPWGDTGQSESHLQNSSFSTSVTYRAMLTWQAVYAIARGVTFLIPIIDATHVLTLAWSCLRARRLFSMISVPWPSPSILLADEGEVKRAFNPYNVIMRHESIRKNLLTITNSLDFMRPCSRLPASAAQFWYINRGHEFSETMKAVVRSRMPALTLDRGISVTCRRKQLGIRNITYTGSPQHHSAGQSNLPHMSFTNPRWCLSVVEMSGIGWNSMFTHDAMSSLRVPVSSPRAESAPRLS